jgi:hypothetical protein
MTTPFATFGGVYVVSGDVNIPMYGMWTADLLFAADAEIPTDGDLVIGDLTLRGHVYRQALYGGSREALLIAGAGGWLKEIEERHYRLSSGVSKRIVLQDAAAEVGESINVPGSDIVGNDYVRSKGPASRVVRKFADTWFVDPQGVTQLGPWPTTAITSPFVVVNQRGGQGRITIATETYAAWLPNASFSSPFLEGTYTANGVRMSLTDEGTARVEVLT